MDIDIDMQTNFDPSDVFDIKKASIVDNGKLKKHQVGVYFQNMPVDPITGLASIPYKEAEKEGYIKIDFLHLSILDHFENKDQIRKLSNIEPDWALLEDEEVVLKLFQIHKHYSLLNMIKPTTVLELADCLALIRPSKAFLLNKYIEMKKKKQLNSFRKDVLYSSNVGGGYSFKKGHAISYALTIVLQLHLIKGNCI